MKKRALSWLLALTMLLTLAPQTLPVWASATGEKSSTATQTESKLSANTYSALGLSRSVDPEKEGLDKTKQPYGKADAGSTIATNVINELYVNFNGSIHYGWSILDNIPMEFKDGQNISWNSPDNFHGAMGFWRPGQQGVHYKDGASSYGALFGHNGKTVAAHNEKIGDIPSKSISSANKHLTYQYSKSEAFSPNTGKDNYVAEMTIDSGSQVNLYIYQVEGGNKRYVRSKFVCYASESGGNASDKTNIIYNWEYDAMYDIAAGDMDGDGYDEIAVYAQNKVYVYSFKGGNLSSSPIATHDVTPPTVTSGDARYKKLKTAVVTLAFGDLNADDKDELVIAENIGYGATNIATGKVGIYRLETNESTKKNTLVKAMKDDISLAVPSSSGIFNAAPMVRYANVATGDIDGDYQDELIIAGYISSKMPNATCNRGDIAYMIVKGGSDNQFTHSDWKAVDKNKNRIDLLDRVVDNKDQLIPPVALTCAATQGVGYAEQVFLGGYLYSVTGANEQKTNVENYSLNALTRISTNREYKKDNGDKANKEEIFVVNVVAGNFNGNRNGQEQIVYAFGMKHDDSDRYWYDIGYINKKAPGPENANQSSSYWYGQEQVMNYESSYNRDDNKARASLYLSLAAVDCDDDSTLMRYKGKTVTWTKPEVLTVLQSAPYFQDLQDTRDYLNQGQTAYGKGSSSGTSGTAGGSLKLGTYVSFEQDFSVFGVKVASIEAEAQSTHAFTYDYEHTKTKELNITYSGSAGDDYAVVYAVPYMEYQYETWVPGYKLPDNRDEYNKYLDEYIRNTRGKNKVDSDNNASASITITQADRDKVATELGIGPGTEVKGSWQPSSVMVPMDPAKVILSVDDYDAIAEQTEGLEPIRGNILNSTPGDPLTYDGENVNKGFTAIGDWQTMTKAEGTNISLESSTTVSEEHTFAYNYEFEAKAGAGAGGVTVGVLAGFGTSAGGGVSTSNSTSYSATVDNLPKDADGYTLSWQFGYRTAKLNNNDVLVLEYRQKNAHAKPSLPQNLRVNSVTANSVTLSWDPVVGSGAYEIYQVSTTDSNTKYLRARVPGTAESYTDTRVTPGSSYTYCVKNITQAGEESIYSTNVVATTLTDTNGKFVINQQPESKITTYAGGTTTATIDAEYLDKNGDPQTLDYFWERYDSATKTWKYIGKGTTLSVSVPSDEKQADTMDGTKYRCQVFYNANLYIYSEPVTLTIGKANSATTLTSDNTSPTVNASYVKTETVETSEQADVPVTETKDNKTYTKYKVKDDTTEKIVYIDEDGKYYTSNNGTVGSLITPDETNVQLTYAVKTTKTVGGVATTEVDIKTIQFSSLTKQTPTEGETITYTSKDEDGTSITTYADCTVLAKYTDASNATTVYKCSTTVTDETTQENTTITFWFVQIKSGETVTQYPADIDTKTTITLDGTPVDLDDLEQVTQKENVKKEVQTYVKGTEVTLTASLKDNNTGEPILADNDKVVFKIVNSVGDGSATVTATATNGTATATWTPTAAGVYTITAAYEGNEKYMGSVSSQTITINVVVPGQKTLMIDSPNSMTYGDAAIELKTTLLKGAKNSESASVETNLSNVIYSVKESGATISSDGKFTPTAAGTYTVTATYTSGSETLTATKSIVVNKRTVTIVPSVDKETKDKGFTLDGIANEADKALFSLKTKQNQTGNVDISCAGINTTAAGEYRITVTYTATPDIDKNYIVVCDNTQVYEIKDNVVKVTNATNNSNGSVELKYSLKDSNDLVSVPGTSMYIPKNAKLIAVASPKRGYRVEKWTEKVGEAQEDTIFSSGNVYETSNTITIPSEKLQTDKYSIRADFAEVYYNLTIGFQPDKTGSIEAYYLTDDGMKGDTFYSSTSPSLTPTTATKKLSPLKKVRITATPAEGQVISGWRIYSGDNDQTGTLVENNGTIYTGNTYTVSSINANTQIVVETAKKTEKAIKVTLVGQDGVKLGEQASVSFNAKEATSVDGTYTYTTAQHGNVVINLTIPDSLIVDSWKIGETEQNVGTLSNNKKTLSISNLQLTADRLDLTVHCKAPNSYPVKVEQKVGETTVTGADALPATVKITKNGTTSEVSWSDTNNNKVPEATILRVIIQEKPGYELQSVSCNGREQTTQDTEGGKAFTINGVYAGVNIVATFVKLKEYTVTFSVVDTNGDEPGGTNGILTAIAERKGKEYPGFETGNHVYAGSTVTFTATPDEGYRVKEWRVGTEVYRPDGSTTDFIEERLTLDAVKAAKGVTVQFTPIGNKVIIQAEGQGTITSARVGLTEQLGNISEGFVLQGGSAVTITAAPSQGYEVMHWIVNGKIVPGTENQNRYTYSAETNSSGALIKAVFQPVNYTVRWSGENGTVTKTDGETTKEAQVRGGTSIIFHAAPDNGYVLSGWTVNGETVENATNPDFTWSVPLGVPAEQEYTVKAIFQRNATPLTVTYQVEGNVGGTIATANGQDGSVSVVYGGDVTFTAEPDEYYSVKEWKVGSNTVPNSDNKSEYTLQNVTEDTMVTVVFQKALSFTVRYEAGQNGTIQAKENGQSLQLETEHTKDIPGGSTLEFKAVPATGSPNYMVAKWTVNNVEVTKDNMSKLGVTMEQGHPLSNTLTIENLSRNVVVKAEFVKYTKVAVPSAGTGYVIQDVQRVPAETYVGAPENQIRTNGDLTFTIAPNSTAGYTTIGELKIGGHDFINGGTNGKVSVVKNVNGTYTVTVTGVTALADVTPTVTAYKVKAIPGLSNYQVPENLTNVNLDTVEKIQAKLTTNLTGRKDGTAFYDIALMTWGTIDGKPDWVPVTEDNFPANGVDVVLDYPGDTNAEDTFKIVHMLTTAKNGKTPGTVENVPYTKESDGLHFHVDSLSPFGVSWVKYVAPTPGGGGGGGGAVSTCTLTFDTNGGSAIDKITKDSGTTIDLAAYKPTRAGYTFAGWFSDKALTKAVTSVKLTANTTVYAKWTQNGGTAQNPFVDVKEGAYYYDAVLWAVEQKITSGTSATTFSPDASCTRAQMVTFLWRAAGSPKVENGKNPFADVQADAYYYDAVLWAVEKGVTSGTSATTFSPDATVTRGQTVTFLYRNAGSPEVSGTMPFTDVEADAYYAKAVQWAVQQKITTGTSETTFSPMSDCTRGQIVTFLYRAK